MATKVVRRKTKTPNIYYNETTGKYDVKYNYKIYNPITQKHEYKAKWKYGSLTVNEAKAALAELQTGGNKAPDTEATLEGVYQLWLKEAQADGLALNTLRNTEQQLKMIYQFLPKETKLKNITGDTYTELIAKCRNKKYSEETLHNINACFRKLIRLAWKKELISENPLAKVKNKKFNVAMKHDEFSPKFITKAEFQALDDYFSQNSFVRLGTDRYEGYRLMVNFLYYTGVRIGELLALNYNDIQGVLYYHGRKIDEADWFEYDTYMEKDENSFDGFQVIINKVFLEDGSISSYEARIRDGTKNKKNRVIPLPPCLSEMYIEYHAKQRKRGVADTERIFPWTAGNSEYMLNKACEKTNIRHHSPHDFRHTFISLMLENGLSLAKVEMFSGDSQETILKRYSHADNDSKMALINMWNDVNK